MIHKKFGGLQVEKKMSSEEISREIQTMNWSNSFLSVKDEIVADGIKLYVFNKDVL